MSIATRTFYVALIVAASFGILQAQAAPSQFVPFRAFIENTKAAGWSIYTARTESRVKDAAAFEEMRQHILTMYQGVHASHSFVRDNNHVDCVPIMEQPSVRLLGLKEIATPPATGRPG